MGNRYLNSILIAVIIFHLAACVKTAPESESDHLVEDVILFSKNPNGHNELYKLQNGEQTLLISDPEYDFWWPKVSPDKSKILVYRTPTNPDKNHDDYQEADLMIADIDGSNLDLLIAKNQYDWNAQGVCRWNKDGSKILMCAEIQTGAGFQWRLVTTNSDGTDPKVLSDYWAIDCNFSIDNEKVVFMGFKDNNLIVDFTKLELQEGDYDAMNNTVSNIVSLTDNDTRDHDPDFSPDNMQIVFSAGNSLYTNVDLKIYNTITNTVRTLLDDSAANGGSMCWSTDGKYIFFHSINFLRSPFRIKCVEVETGRVSTILEEEGNDFGFFHPEAY